jgi:hypothetical protein
MDTTNTKVTPSSSSKIASEPRPGLVPGVAQLAIEVVERTQVTALAILQDVRGELRTIVDGGFDIAEKAVGSMLRIGRKLTHRVDEAIADTLTGAERVVGSAARSARDTTRSAAELAGTAFEGVVGGRAASA